MKIKHIFTATLIVATSSFAIDLFLPVANQKAQFMGGLELYHKSKWYDSEGNSKSQGNDGQNNGFTLTPGIKYGLVPNLEVQASVPVGIDFWSSKTDNNNEMGMSQPSIAAKYGIQGSPVAVFVDFKLPFGSESFVGNDPLIYTTIGALMSQQAGNLSLRGALDYTIRHPHNDWDAGNVFHLDARPGFVIQSGLIAFLQIDGTLAGRSSYNGNDQPGSASHLLYVAPGAIFQINEKAKVEATLPFTLLGKNDANYFALRAQAFIDL